MLTIMELWYDPKVQEHLAYVRGDLQRKLKEQDYVAELKVDIAKGPISRAVHPEFYVLDLWDQVGAFLKYGLIDERSLLDIVAPQVLGSWTQLEPVISRMRERYGPSAFENVEYAPARARLWLDRYPDGTYPKHTPRMPELLAKRAQEEQ